MANMKGKTVVITGASSGFGRGTAMRLSERGANLVLAARRGNLIRQLADECDDALAVTTDVSDANAVTQLAQAAQARFGHIDVWINNAGVAALGRFDEIPLEDHQRVIQTNLIGTINGSYVALQHFRRMGSGTLINIASILGKTPAPYYASYCASKFGIIGLCASLRQELRVQGAQDIHVCAILPMAADTTFFEHAANYTGHTLQPYPLDDASNVIDAILNTIDIPRDEVTVGLSTTAAALAQQFVPWIAETVNGVVTHQMQIENAPPAEPTAGNLHQPVPLGTGVSGSVRSRLNAERQTQRH